MTNKLRQETSKSHNKVLWIVVGVFVLLFLLYRDQYGVKQVGHPFEKFGEYKTVQYVNLFPKRGLVKNYRVKAEIERVTKDYGEDGSERVTRLNKIFFSDNGVVTFVEDDNCELELNKKVYCRDDNLREWYIELIQQTP